MKPRNSIRFAARFAAVLASAVLAASASSVSTLQAPIASGSCGTVTITDFGSYSCTGGSITLGTTPSPFVHATFDGIGDHGTPDDGGTGLVSYFVGINGGNPGDAVPVSIVASLSTSGIGALDEDVVDSSASITLNFANGNSFAQQSVFCGNVLRGEDCSNPAWSGTLHAIAWVGYDNIVTLSTSISIAGAGHADALADPYIFIDPGFAADHPEYSLDLNVGNASPAPEPATWAFGLSALCALAARRLRRS